MHNKYHSRKQNWQLLTNSFL